jgi:hypothetical protein
MSSGGRLQQLENDAPALLGIVVHVFVDEVIKVGYGVPAEIGYAGDVTEVPDGKAPYRRVSCLF